MMYQIILARFIAANDLPHPFIEPQPTIYNISSLYKNKEGDFRQGIFSCKPLTLEFAINYNFSNTNSIENIESKFKFSHTFVQLKQYQKRIQGLEYDWKIHGPKDVSLPAKRFSKNNFKMFIGVSATASDLGKIKTGSQIIAIYDDIDSMLQGTEKDEDIIKRFKKFMDIYEDIHPDNYAYKFIVKVYKFKANGIVLCDVYTLETNTFQFVFNEQNHSVQMEYVDPSGYYIEDIQNIRVPENHIECVII